MTDKFEKVPYNGICNPEYILKNGRAFNIYSAYDYIIKQQAVIADFEKCTVLTDHKVTYSGDSTPPGYTLVPDEPTQKMIDEIAIDSRFSHTALVVRYKAMLKASKDEK